MKSFSLHNGDQIPAIGLGTWKMEDGSAKDAVSTALEVGYRHIDWTFSSPRSFGTIATNPNTSALPLNDLCNNFSSTIWTSI